MKKLIDSFSELNRGIRIFIFALLILSIGILYFNGSGSRPRIVLATAGAGILLWLTQNLWKPRGYRKPYLVYCTLVGFLSLSALTIGNYDKFKPLLNPFYRFLQPYVQVLFDNTPILKSVKVDIDLMNAIAIMLLLMLVLLFNYQLKRNALLLSNTGSQQKNWAPSEMKKLFLSMRTFLKNDLDLQDQETGWEEDRFIPIEAEVKIVRKKNTERKITSLMKAIKRNRWSSTFLVLGESGSGKSVALRKLCRDMLKEATRTGILPVYLNLKEWEPARKWSKEDPPKPSDLEDFARASLEAKFNENLNLFLRQHYAALHDAGRFYYILDSFDEMPAVLDETDGSPLIERIAGTINQFLTHDNITRGILASRPFKSPGNYFKAGILLEIRPLSPYRMKENLIKSASFNSETVANLYKGRTDLVVLASNPFMARLLTSHVWSSTDLPANQLLLFKSYVEARLFAVKRTMPEEKWTPREINSYAVKIAHTMFANPRYGLEIPYDDLMQEFPSQPIPIEKVVTALVEAKLGRLSKGIRRRFSFVHRRFNEYFVVEQLREDNDILDKKSILTGGRYRDVMVLYCEVAPATVVQDWALFCWENIWRIGNEKWDLSMPEHLNAVRCLRFLQDAFLRRRDYLEEFHQSLSGIILLQIRSENLLVRKVAMEAAGFLEKDRLEEVMLLALRTNNPVIRESAFKAIGQTQVDTLNSSLTSALIRYLLSFRFMDFFFKKKDLIFILQLSASFKKILRACNSIAIDQYIFIAGCFLMSTSSDGVLEIIAVALIFYFYRRAYENWSGKTEERATLSDGEVIVRDIWRSFELIFKIPFLQEAGLKIQKHIVNHPSLKLDFSRQTLLVIVARIILSLLCWEAADKPGFQLGWLSTVNLIGGLLVFPFIPIRLFAISSSIPRRTLIFLGWFMPAFLILFALIYPVANIWVAKYSGKVDIFIDKLLSDKIWLVTFAILLVVGFAGSIGFYSSRMIKRFVQDKKTLRSVIYYETMDRNLIGEQLKAFHYPRYRRIMIRNLQKHVRHARNSWPDNRMPHFKDEFSNALLLEMDERWSKIDE